MNLKPDDLVLVHAKSPSEDYNIADQWEATPHQVLSQLADQPVFQVQPMDAVSDENIRVLHRNVISCTICHRSCGPHSEKWW